MYESDIYDRMISQAENEIKLLEEKNLDSLLSYLQRIREIFLLFPTLASTIGAFSFLIFDNVENKTILILGDLLLMIVIIFSVLIYLILTQYFFRLEQAIIIRRQVFIRKLSKILKKNINEKPTVLMKKILNHYNKKFKNNLLEVKWPLPKNVSEITLAYFTAFLFSSALVLIVLSLIPF